jgi:hypothetical protein
MSRLISGYGLPKPHHTSGVMLSVILTSSELRSEMSSTDPTTIGVHRALHEALNSAREARHRLEDGDATPDLDDLVELGTLLAGLSEALSAVNSGMAAKARDAKK